MRGQEEEIIGGEYYGLFRQCGFVGNKFGGAFRLTS
jgi:hypothetical protein